MKIAIIDNVSFTEKQIEILKSISDELTIFLENTTDENEIIYRCKDCEIIILGWTKLSYNILSQLNKLLYIGVWATGYDYIDLEFAKKNKITITNVPSYSSEAVAEYTIGAMIALSRNFIRANEHVSNGYYSWEQFKGTELYGKTLGIVGFGNIGQKVAKLGRGFNMNIISYTKNPERARAESIEVSFVSIKELFLASDFISINIPLNVDTINLIDSELISLMKETAYFINTSRHEIINQDFLVEMLEKNRIKGAALDDIFVNNDKIKQLSNTLLTPHIGFFTNESIIRKSEICLNNILSFINGAPQNTVCS